MECVKVTSKNYNLEFLSGRQTVGQLPLAFINHEPKGSPAGEKGRHYL